MTEAARIRWACRRGMLELDVLLIPFFDECFASLSEDEQARFSELLACDDPDIYAWLMGHESCPHAHFQALLQRIVSHARTPRTHPRVI